MSVLGVATFSIIIVSLPPLASVTAVISFNPCFLFHWQSVAVTLLFHKFPINPDFIPVLFAC